LCILMTRERGTKVFNELWSLWNSMEFFYN
jgi:hypothetical protein